MQIKYKIGVCGDCGKEKLIVVKSKKLCYYCSLKQQRKRTITRKKLRGTYVDNSKLTKFYKEFYDNHPTKKCFESDEFISNYKSWNCHHIIEKAKHPEFTFNEEVCVLLTLEKHALWHSLTEENRELKMPKTYQRYLELKEQFKI